MLINSVQTNSYAFHQLNGDGSAASGTGTASTNRMDIGVVPTDGYASNIFGTLIVDIHNYTSTTNNKTVRCFGGFDGNGSGTVRLGSGFINATTAVTSLSFSNANNSFDWLTGSTFALYGIKGA